MPILKNIGSTVKLQISNRLFSMTTSITAANEFSSLKPKNCDLEVSISLELRNNGGKSAMPISLAST